MNQRNSPIGNSARKELAEIGKEFARRSERFPPLHHSRIKPWSEHGESSITFAQWGTFIEAEGDRLENERWSQWEGPLINLNSMSKSSELGLWTGDPEGLDDFVSLSSSICMALQGEGILGGDWRRWLEQLHEWAFRYQMPLLRCDISLWGRNDDYDLEDFYRISSQWTWGDSPDLCYPSHPIVWRIVDNLFTSSATAIRAILAPNDVIATMNPWPSETVGELFDEWDSRRQVSTTNQRQPFPSNEGNVNSYCFDGILWNIRSEFDIKKGEQRFENTKGLEQVGILLSLPNRHFSNADLQSLFAVPVPRAEMQKARNTDVDSSPESNSGSNSWSQVESLCDEEYDRSTKREIDRLQNEVMRKTGLGEDSSHEQNEIDEIQKFRSSVLGINGKSRLGPSIAERQRKAVSNTIRKTFNETISEKLPGLAVHLKKCLRPTGGGWKYTPLDDNSPWEVKAVNRSYANSFDRIETESVP